MLRKFLLVFLCFALIATTVVFATTEPNFTVVVLGCGGGPFQDNISSYMIWPTGLTNEAVLFDAGTLLVGIQKAADLGNLWDFKIPTDSDLTLPGFVLQNIKAYMISHVHLDHIAGLVIDSLVDSKKDILGISSTIGYLQKDVFNWEVWPNFGDAGPGYPLATYHYVIMDPGEEIAISNTSMTVEAYVLSHSAPYESTAFLLGHDGYYVLYFGDTGPDLVEKSDRMQTVWERVAPLVREGKLLGVFLECAYENSQPDSSLFGHLTPSWMMSEFHQLADIVAPDDPEHALNGLNVVVAHIKPIVKQLPAPGVVIPEQFAELNDLGINFIVPYQGMRIGF